MVEPTQKKILVLETAEKLFAVDGYESTSIRDISKVGSFNSAMISYYFGSKELLLEAIIRFRINKQDQLIAAIIKEGSPMDQIFALTEFYVEACFKQRYFYLLMLQVHSFPDRYTLIKEFLQSIRQKDFCLFENIINEGQQAGLFKPQADTLFLTCVIFGTINNAVLHQEQFLGTKDPCKIQNSDFNSCMNESLKSILKSLVKNFLMNDCT